MNKRIFYLIILLLIICSVFNAKIYFNLKKETLKEYNYLISLENKIKKIYALKEKYKINNRLLNNLEKYCNIKDTERKYLIICKNLDPTKFNSVQNIIFKNNFKIKTFDIEKNKFIIIKVEIDK